MTIYWPKFSRSVPQGSVLGPIFFSLYMFSMSQKHCTYFDFFDNDTQLDQETHKLVNYRLVSNNSIPGWPVIFCFYIQTYLHKESFEMTTEVCWFYIYKKKKKTFICASHQESFTSLICQCTSSTTSQPLHDVLLWNTPNRPREVRVTAAARFILNLSAQNIWNVTVTSKTFAYISFYTA